MSNQKTVSTVITFAQDPSLNPLWPTIVPCAHCEELTHELEERDRELEDMGVKLDRARAQATRERKLRAEALAECERLKAELARQQGEERFNHLMRNRLGS
jgi:hypothetical protein